MSPLINIQNLSVGYDNKLIDAVNLEFDNQGLIAIMGLNGSGKSTFVKTLTGQINPKSGDVYLEGKKLKDYSKNEIAQRVGITFYDKELTLDVFSYVALGRTPYLSWELKLSQKEEEKVSDVLDCMNLAALKGRSVKNLSDGEKQRVAIAKLLAQETKVLILDEPTAHLDLKAKHDVFKLLKELSKTRLILFISHDLENVSRYADELLLINHCKLERIKDKKIFKDRVETAFELRDSFSG